MAEIIGVAASATQLGAACFHLIDLTKKIKGGASTLKRYHGQLQELQSISTCISQNPLLQTPEIGTQTIALLSIINNNCINSLLTKGRFLRTWGFLYREQDLLDIFVRLERQKSNLSLSIGQIQSRALYQIQNDIQLMADKKSQQSLTAGTSSGVGPSVITSLTPPPSPTTVQIPAESRLPDQYPQPDFTPRSKMNPSPSQSSSDSQVPTRPSVNQLSPECDQSDRSNPGGTMGPQWINPRAGPGFEQENGRRYDINGPLARELSKNSPQYRSQNSLRFINPTIIGHGNQYNRNIVEYSGDISGATEPDMSGDVWDNPQALPGPSTDRVTGNVGRQVNGIVIRYRESSGDTEKS